MLYLEKLTQLRLVKLSLPPCMLFLYKEFSYPQVNQYIPTRDCDSFPKLALYLRTIYYRNLESCWFSFQGVD